MPRLIDADALLREFDPDDPEDGMYNILARGKIVQAPTVDAVQVVRCADCRHAVLIVVQDNYLDPPRCDGMQCNRHSRYVDYTDFCSDGQRENGGDAT